MGVGIRSFFEVFGTDERFLIFALGSLVLAVALFSMTKGASRATQLLLGSGALLIVLAFVILAPLNALNLLGSQAQVSPVALNFNFGFLALGLGLLFKFRKGTPRER